MKQSIRHLGTEYLTALRDWFFQYNAAKWDRQIEEDTRSGKLDRLAEETLSAHKAGRTNLL